MKCKYENCEELLEGNNLFCDKHMQDVLKDVFEPQPDERSEELLPAVRRRYGLEFIKQFGVRRYILLCVRHLFKVPDECYMPKYLTWVYVLLFPFENLFLRQKIFNYDPMSQTITIHKMKYSIHIFEMFAFGRPGTIVKIIDRKDGHLTLERMYNYEEMEQNKQP